MSVCRGVRGATTVEENTRESILEGTRQLLEQMTELNQIGIEDVASIFFTTSPDLNAGYPAEAARQMGWQSLAMLCGHEMNVPNGLEKCVRVLLHWNTDKPAAGICHVYTGGASRLRPDWAIENE